MSTLISPEVVTDARQTLTAQPEPATPGEGVSYAYQWFQIDGYDTATGTPGRFAPVALGTEQTQKVEIPNGHTAIYRVETSVLHEGTVIEVQSDEHTLACDSSAQ